MGKDDDVDENEDGDGHSDDDDDDDNVDDNLSQNWSAVIAELVQARHSSRQSVVSSAQRLYMMLLAHKVEAEQSPLLLGIAMPPST